MYDEEEGVFIVLCDVESWYMFVVELDWGWEGGGMVPYCGSWGRRRVESR